MLSYLDAIKKAVVGNCSQCRIVDNCFGCRGIVRLRSNNIADSDPICKELMEEDVMSKPHFF